MKTIYKLFATFATFLAFCLFVSCDSDTDRAMVLSGEWEGDFGMSYEYNGRIYDSYDSNLKFVPDYDYAKHGYGIQVDYYRTGPYEYQYYKFDWEVRNGKICLDYRYDPQLNVVLYDYDISNNRFSGYIGDSRTRFNLYKMTDYYDWTPYVNTYGYGSYYNAPAMRSIGENIQTINFEKDVHPFNRFNNKSK